MQVLISALAVNLGSTPVEVEVVAGVDESPLLGLWAQLATLKPGLGLKLGVELALVWNLRSHRSPSLLELRLNQARIL